jgi:hypothetical protein
MIIRHSTVTARTARGTIIFIEAQIWITAFWKKVHSLKPFFCSAVCTGPILRFLVDQMPPEIVCDLYFLPVTVQTSWHRVLLATALDPSGGRSAYDA